MKVIILTQHAATVEQVQAGVFEPANKSEVQNLLTFSSCPSKEETRERAKKLAVIAKESGASAAMIGGAPWLMAPLERALEAEGIEVLYSFTQRMSEEQVMPDGTVKKTQVFRHVDWA